MSEALAKKRKIQKYLGNVEVNIEHCKGCGFCVEFCPTGALELSKSFNKKGYHPPLMVDQNYCNGCDLCGFFCPDFAIFGFRVGPNPNYKKDEGK
jgi:2-oxoglutarate ferredoxin oxidoreductase subunit delta